MGKINKLPSVLQKQKEKCTLKGNYPSSKQASPYTWFIGQGGWMPLYIL